ncbi:MAG TPA: carbon-nitrogen hydrolase family protein [Nevskiaceae bacterium]
MANETCDPLTSVGPHTVRLAAVQAAPVWMDRAQTVHKAARLVAEAAAQGAQLIGFPENFIPGHPTWYYYHSSSSRKSADLVIRLFQQSVDLSGHDLDEIREAAAAHHIDVVLGVTERLPGTTGTLFNTQVFIDRSGAIAGKHQKLVPTRGERLVHAPGDAATQRSFRTGIGTVSSLVCGENSNPLAIARVAAEYPLVHVSSWPSHFSRGWANMRDASLMVSRSVAYTCGCFVILSASLNAKEMIEALDASEEETAFMRDPAFTGGAAIIDPVGRVIAGPLTGDKDAIACADADLDLCIRSRASHDFAGHYNRSDVYQLRVNLDSRPLVSMNAGPPRDESPDYAVAARGENTEQRAAGRGVAAGGDRA